MMVLSFNKAPMMLSFPFGDLNMNSIVNLATGLDGGPAI